LTCNNSSDIPSGAFFNSQFIVPGNFWYTGAHYKVTFGLTVFTSLNASFLYNAFYWSGHTQFFSGAGSYTQWPLGNINASFSHGATYQISFDLTHPNAVSTASPIYAYVGETGLVNHGGYGLYNAVAQPVTVNTAAPGGAFQLLTQYLQDSVGSVTITSPGLGCNGGVTFSAPTGPGGTATGTATVDGGGGVTGVTIIQGGSTYAIAPTVTFAGCTSAPTYTVTLRGNKGNALQLTHITVERIN
jgi:hypothetical protein